MEIPVHMFAFMGGEEIRMVEVPDDIVVSYANDSQKLNSTIYSLGQNESQLKEAPSVSPGDIIEWSFVDPPRYFQVELIGFHELTVEQFNELSSSDEPPGSVAMSMLMHLGIDPLRGMPSELKVLSLQVLVEALGDSAFRDAFTDTGTATADDLSELEQFAQRALDSLRRDGP